MFHHVISVKLLPNASTEDIDQIKKEIIQLNQYKGTVIPKIPEFNFIAQSIENQHLFEEVITGNPNSRVAYSGAMSASNSSLKKVKMMLDHL